MRTRKIALVTFLSLFLILFTAQITARADDDDSVADDYDVTTRVVRVSFIQGDVQVKRHDSDAWEAAQLNTPLVEGDTLTTASDARAEIQIDARNFLRIAAGSEVQIITLRNEGIALSLAEGAATLRLAHFDKDHEYFEIDAPQTTIAAEKEGVYRVDVAHNGDVRVAVREDGLARLYAESSVLTLKNGRAANFNLNGDQSGEWQLGATLAVDSWDNWVSERERFLAANFKYEEPNRHYDGDVWGAEDLDAYGTWEQSNDYGWIWRPNTTAITSYDDWTPYRYGSWVWCAPYGWTWVGDEPWGWAPYHYGRWVFYNNYWAWCPHSYYPHHRSWWRPALVVFISIDFSLCSHVCWYPLAYRQRDPRSNYSRLHDRSGHAGELANLNPAYRRAVTGLPTREFGDHRSRPQPPADDVARRVIGAQPLRGEPPFRHNTSGSGRVSAGHPGPTGQDTGVRQRQTGAATRTPGVGLDDELRRRVFNGREPGTPTGIGGSKGRTTGAVLRPSIPADPRANRGTEPLPTRSPDDRPEHRDRRPPPPGPSTLPPASTSGSTSGRPAEKRERPDRNERPTITPRPDASAAQPPPPEHSEAPAHRHQDPPSARPDPPSRPAPPPRHSEPPARPAPPASRADPPSRPAPPPQHSEPPARSAPPASRPDPPARPAPTQRAEPEKTREEHPARPDKKPNGQ